MKINLTPLPLQLPVLLLLLLLSSCNHYFYAPNTHNVPMMRERGEARLMTAYYEADEIHGFETQVAYSPVNHLGLTANFLTVKGGDDRNGGHGRQLEAGAGYYLPTGRRSVFEVYAGYGGGKVFNAYDSTETYSLRFRKLYIQPAFGFTSDYFDIIGSLRFAYCDTKSDDIVDTYYNPHSVLRDVEGTPSFFVMEPGLTIRGGWKFLKVQTHIGGSFNLTTPSYPQEEQVFSIGLYSSFTPAWLNGRKRR